MHPIIFKIIEEVSTECDNCGSKHITRLCTLSLRRNDIIEAREINKVLNLSLAMDNVKVLNSICTNCKIIIKSKENEKD